MTLEGTRTYGSGTWRRQRSSPACGCSAPGIGTRRAPKRCATLSVRTVHGTGTGDGRTPSARCYSCSAPGSSPSRLLSPPRRARPSDGASARFLDPATNPPRQRRDVDPESLLAGDLRVALRLGDLDHGRDRLGTRLDEEGSEAVGAVDVLLGHGIEAHREHGADLRDGVALEILGCGGHPGS